MFPLKAFALLMLMKVNKFFEGEFFFLIRDKF